MPLDYSTQQLRVTFAELAFRSESIAMVLDQAIHELPAGYAANIADVIALLKDDADKLRTLAERTQGGRIQVLDCIVRRSSCLLRFGLLHSTTPR